MALLGSTSTVLPELDPQELYFSNDYGSCVTLTAAGPLAGAVAKDCSCKFQDVYTPGCYRASDALPGTAWFIVESTQIDARFSLPPMQQNVGAADILNVGPEEAAKALNRQRQQLILSRRGMDTGEIPEKVTKRMLDAATKNPSGIREQRRCGSLRDPSSAKYSVNATVSIMGHALATLKSGKPLADAVFGGDTSHLIQPHLPTPRERQACGGALVAARGNLPLPKSSFKGKFPDFKEKEEPVERIRFSGDFESIIGENAGQFLEELSELLWGWDQWDSV
eukprot:s2445_g7.t1